MANPAVRLFHERARAVRPEFRVDEATAASVVALWWGIHRAREVDTTARRWSHALLLLALLQVAVGITTLLLRVPLPLAAMHQAGAVLVFTCAVALRHALRGRALQP